MVRNTSSTKAKSFCMDGFSRNGSLDCLAAKVDEKHPKARHGALPAFKMSRVPSCQA
jgi:hypothetical protein